MTIARADFSQVLTKKQAQEFFTAEQELFSRIILSLNFSSDRKRA